MKHEVNRQWCLARRPVGLVKESDFEWREGPVPVPGPRQVLVRNRYVSLSATERSWMREEDTYLPPQRLGEVVRALTVGNVVQSNHPGLPAGSNVMGTFGWQDFAVTDGGGEFFMPLPDETQIPATMQLALFGPVGVAAYFGLKDVARPTPGDVLVVSAAAGAVGCLVGQIGKLLGCHVVGVTGSEKKCRWLTGELGFDVAINYKSESVFKRLRQSCPGGIDIYFDSVGGPMLEDALNLLNLRARVGNTANEIESMRAESERIDSDLVSAGTQILDPSLTKEQRAQLLIDSKHMAERKGEIKAQIPQLESDLQSYQRELDDYRATLRYVE
jgi:hypothetical protein